MSLWLELALMLVIILISAQLFSNALEYFSENAGLSSGVTGSILAAISTALPETMVPLLAVIAGTPDKLVNQEISVGAILGAPLMLSTLSTSIMALSVIKKRGIYGRIKPEKTGFIRDVNFFLMAFFLAAIAMYVPNEPRYYRSVISILLIGLYSTYIIMTLRASKNLVQNGHGVTPTEPLFFTKLGIKSSTKLIVMQLLIGLCLLLIGAKGFINTIHAVSIELGLSALLLSLLIIPLATELPEKVNSVLWVRDKKDTLGFGNITGAMVFQGTLLPAFGILLTPWQPGKVVLTGIVMTFIAALWLRFNASSKGLSIAALLVNGLLYVTYLVLILS
ncbi:MAG: sodium:calcium antiporter [Legionella sp.]|nr:sodium:calcium antiporter [Legionella sp.]